MQNKWNDAELETLSIELGQGVSVDLAARTYTARLLGSEPDLVLHGGGNTSVKTTWRDRFGTTHDVLAVKASGFDLATVPAEGHALLLLEPVRRLLAIDLSDQQMADELRGCLVDWRAPNPSIETLMHAVIPQKFVDHTHADAILTLTNQRNAEALFADALGPGVVTIPYIKAGFELAKVVNRALAEHPGCLALVLMQHGIVTWGDRARDSYWRMIGLVSRAETFLAARATRVFVAPSEAVKAARARYVEIAPALRGCLARPSGDADRPYDRFVLRPLITPRTLGLLETQAKRLLVTPPLTPDHLIRTKPLPLWIESPQGDEPAAFAQRLRSGIEAYAKDYEEYFNRFQSRLAPGLSELDPAPRVIFIPGVGVVCAGENARAADVARDITEHTLAAKEWFAASGCDYLGLGEEHVFDMEYLPQQHAKLSAGRTGARLGREVAVVTGAAGAIGLGICEQLLGEGCHLVVTDLPGESLTSAVEGFQKQYPGRVLGVALDVTEPDSVKQGYEKVIEEWGGIDLVIVNAGIALVSSLAEMKLDAFRRLERVNVEGTLLILAEAARHFRLQNTGGDVILVSTKNVFAPGAKFGAYSATKAASHQLARIASLEMADLGVRVNMVAPDAVFSHGARRSGLWAEVGPDRMKARGLDEKGLEDYYQSRNLLKAKVTAEHVGRAVLYFATRQTPTTGATIPVDGGLPDSTPR